MKKLIEQLEREVNEFCPTWEPKERLDRIKGLIAEMKSQDGAMICDVCGCNPSVMVQTNKGRFCQKHVKY